MANWNSWGWLDQGCRFILPCQLAKYTLYNILPSIHFDDVDFVGSLLLFANEGLYECTCKHVQNIQKFIHAYDHRIYNYIRDAALCKQKIHTILHTKSTHPISQPPELFVVPLPSLACVPGQGTVSANVSSLFPRSRKRAASPGSPDVTEPLQSAPPTTRKDC